MKAKILISLTLAMGLLCGCNPEQPASPAPPVPLWAQMQEAVLQKQDLHEVQRILRAGFDVNAPIGCGTYSAVDGAVSVGNVAMLKLLLAAGAAPKGEALLAAAFYREPAVAAAMVHVLLSAGADVNFKEEFPAREPETAKRISTALHKACFRGHSKVVRLLLEQPGIETNLVDVDGRTPLMWAEERGHEEIVRMLLKKGAGLKPEGAAQASQPAVSPR